MCKSGIKRRCDVIMLIGSLLVAHHPEEPQRSCQFSRRATLHRYYELSTLHIYSLALFNIQHFFRDTQRMYLFKDFPLCNPPNVCHFDLYFHHLFSRQIVQIVIFQDRVHKVWKWKFFKVSKYISISYQNSYRSYQPRNVCWEYEENKFLIPCYSSSLR